MSEEEMLSRIERLEETVSKLRDILEDLAMNVLLHTHSESGRGRP